MADVKEKKPASGAKGTPGKGKGKDKATKIGRASCRERV